MANESLQASFGLDIAPLQQSLSRATNLVRNFAVGLTGYVSAKALFSGLKESLDLGGHLQDLSNKTGIGAGALYDMGEAGRDAGLSLDDITSAVNKMQKAFGKSENASVLRALGLDQQTLASAKPEEAFQKIGRAIAALPNATERTVVAMQLFGKSGAQMLQLFNDPSFKNGIGSSEAARLLNENAAVFDRLSDAIGRTGPRLKEFFTGFNSENAANLERIASVMERLNVTQAGVNAGTIVATFTESIASGQFGRMLWLSMQVAVGNFTNNMIGGALAMGRTLWEVIGLLFRKETWQAFGNALMSFVNSFNATLMHGIGMLLEKLEKAPVIGKYFSGISATVNGIGDRYALAAANQSNTSFDLAQGLFNDIVKKASDSFEWGKVIDTTGLDAELQTLMDELYAGVSDANKKARDEANDNAAKNLGGAYDASAIGMGAKASIVADSLAKVGGGGFAVGPGSSNPILEENKRQTNLLSQIHQALRSSGMGSASFDGLTA